MTDTRSPAAFALHRFARGPLSPMFSDAPALSLDEAQLDAVLARTTTAPRALDRLDCQPVIQKREGQPFRPLIVVSLSDIPVLMSADTARRLAVRQDARGRTGAAHDMIAAADLAEALSRAMQKAMH